MKYIVNADDFGRTETVNEAILYGFQNGYLDRTTIMVNMPYFEQAVEMAEKYGFKDKVGLHINLTSGTPLTEEIKKCSDFCNNEGNFNSKIFKEKRLQFYISKKDKQAVNKEIEAQIQKYLENGFTLMHADSHGHVHTFLSLNRLVINQLKRYKFVSLRLSLNIGANKTKKTLKYIFINRQIINFNKQSFLRDYKYFGAFREVIQANKGTKRDFITEIMLHPNIFDRDMQIGQGYHYIDLQKWKRVIDNERK